MSHHLLFVIFWPSGSTFWGRSAVVAVMVVAAVIFFIFLHFVTKVRGTLRCKTIRRLLSQQLSLWSQTIKANMVPGTCSESKQGRFRAENRSALMRMMLKCRKPNAASQA